MQGQAILPEHEHYYAPRRNNQAASPAAVHSATGSGQKAATITVRRCA